MSEPVNIVVSAVDEHRIVISQAPGWPIRLVETRLRRAVLRPWVRFATSYVGCATTTPSQACQWQGQRC